MGYNQQNAGMHIKTFKKNYFDKEADAELIERVNYKKEEEYIKKIELCNFVIIAIKRGKRKRCICGGKLNYQSNIMIKYRNDDRVMENIITDGKICVDCGRKLVIRSEILDKIYKHEDKIKEQSKMKCNLNEQNIRYEQLTFKL